MKIGLFVPCFVNELFPDAAMATLELLEKLGQDVDYPLDQTCCGQPLFNSGFTDEVVPLAKRFVELFAPYDYVVSPSGSCTSLVKHRYPELRPHDQGAAAIAKKTYELVEFLHDILKVDALKSAFPHKVILHNSCHAQRELGLASPSELNIPAFSKSESLLRLVEGVELMPKSREDECCGFGGTFAVNEEAVSCFMGNDRLDDYQNAGAEYVTGVDSSCLMHLDGLIRRQNRPLKTIHIAQILNGAAS